MILLIFLFLFWWDGLILSACANIIVHGTVEESWPLILFYFAKESWPLIIQIFMCLSNVYSNPLLEFWDIVRKIVWVRTQKADEYHKQIEMYNFVNIYNIYNLLFYSRFNAKKKKGGKK